MTLRRSRTLARLNRLAMWVVGLQWSLRPPPLKLERLGTYYGGWTLPVDLLPPQAVCYCAGVGEDTSLEEQLLRRDCRVWSFDPTPRAELHVRRQRFDRRRFSFLQVGIWDRREIMRFHVPHNPAHVSHSLVNLQGTDSFFEAECTTIGALMRQLGHSRLDLLKLNIEGAEWRVLENVLDERVSCRVLCVLFCQPSAFWRIAAMVRTLRQRGYTLLCRDGWKFTFVQSAALVSYIARMRSHAA